ncbi:hypothetical protein QJS66_01160 [Kocuria rhizophila]|nr:hypothetical protein QJS66_01160 [Kocuria rhizophila]
MKGVLQSAPAHIIEPQPETAGLLLLRALGPQVLWLVASPSCRNPLAPALVLAQGDAGVASRLPALRPTARFEAGGPGCRSPRRTWSSATPCASVPGRRFREDRTGRTAR